MPSRSLPFASLNPCSPFCDRGLGRPFLLLAMLELSWCHLLISDPGRLDSAIRFYGADSIADCPPCLKCGLPKPPRCRHCSKCGACVLFMDHHCRSLGTCLSFRNFKSFVLVLLYGASASGLGAGILFTAAFVDLGQSRLTQLALALFCAAAAAALAAFASLYLRLKRNNSTTIEEMFGREDGRALPGAPVFEDGPLALLPFPRRINPFELLRLTEG
jgi:hypothetical protein